MSLQHDAVTWEEMCRISRIRGGGDAQGLSEFSNYLEDGDTRTECNWYKANEEKETKRNSGPTSFLHGSDPITETTIIQSQLIDLVRISDGSRKLSSY